MEGDESKTIGNTSVSVGNPWVFFGVTFAITWGFWILTILLGLGANTPGGILLLFLGLTGPGVAGIAFVCLVYDEPGRKDFWDRLTNVRRIPARWFLVILLLPLIVIPSAAVVEITLGGTSASLADWVTGTDNLLLSILPTLFMATLVPLLEETGWRGYALDRLQFTHSALVASLILGVVWSLWHLPMFFVEGWHHHENIGFLTLEFWMFHIGIVWLSVAFTWVYNNTRRSIIGAIILHAAINFTAQTFTLTGRAEVFHIALWFVVVVLVTVIWGAKTFRKDNQMPHPPTESEKRSLDEETGLPTEATGSD
ncbi:type II CAAX endopeptidase family protein [Halorubrum vacuolatum]|uniref:Membrane protease YdiL, CAAX protease family n=1 Tax=Halorubrum vacuolatum TaxID=63740 RepID=A0A238WD94_HALVU|nr:type II CAAX endopeptidase family protein [Halorubrum vacuolatum]SNR44213.1 Membrane protease YdiL, CAAX protease family [Halorubrum vacuolatum]